MNPQEQAINAVKRTVAVIDADIPPTLEQFVLAFVGLAIELVTILEQSRGQERVN